MVGDPRDPLECRPVLEALEPIMAATSLEAAAAATVRGLAELTGAQQSGLVLVLHGAVFQEFWHPEDAIQQSAMRKYLRNLAIQAAQRAMPIVHPFPEHTGMHLEASVHLFALEHRVTGTLCLARDPRRRWSDDLMERIVRLVALRLSAIQLIEGERRTSEQYERWFRVSVRQMRALDCERQKFPALATLVDACVFVADRTGVIRWSSRALVEHYPGPGKNGSWVGRPCRELCERIEGGWDATSDSCVVQRLLEGRADVDDPALGEGRPRMRARPIKDAEGQSQEVIVVLEPSNRGSERRVA